MRRLDYMQARGEACIASQHRDECSSHSITAVSSPAVRAMFRKAGLNVSGAWSVRSKFRKSIKVLVPFAFPSSSGFFWSLFSLSKASTDLFDLRPSLLGGLHPFTEFHGFTQVFTVFTDCFNGLCTFGSCSSTTKTQLV